MVVVVVVVPAIVLVLVLLLQLYCLPVAFPVGRRWALAAHVHAVNILSAEGVAVSDVVVRRRLSLSLRLLRQRLRTDAGS